MDPTYIIAIIIIIIYIYIVVDLQRSRIVFRWKRCVIGRVRIRRHCEYYIFYANYPHSILLLYSIQHTYIIYLCTCNATCTAPVCSQCYRFLFGIECSCSPDIGHCVGVGTHNNYYNYYYYYYYLIFIRKRAYLRIVSSLIY